MRQHYPFTPAQNGSKSNQQLIVRTALNHYHHIVATICNPETASIETIIKYATRLNQDVIYCQSMSGNRHAALWAQLATALLSKLSTLTEVDIWDCFGKQLQNMWHQESDILSSMLHVWFCTKESIDETTAIDTIRHYGKSVPDEMSLIIDMFNAIGMGTTFRGDTLYLYGLYGTTAVRYTDNDNTSTSSNDKDESEAVTSDLNTLIELTKRVIALRGKNVYSESIDTFYALKQFDYEAVCDPNAPRTAHLIVYFCIQITRTVVEWSLLNTASGLINSYLPMYIKDSITTFTFNNKVNKDIVLKGNKKQRESALAIIVDALDNLEIETVVGDARICYTFPMSK